MEPKKTKKADLEWKKPTFFLLGIAVALLIVFLAFEYGGTREKRESSNRDGTEIEPEVIECPIIIQPDLPPPTPTAGITLVDDKSEIPDYIPDVEDNPDRKYPEVIYTPVPIPEPEDPSLKEPPTLFPEIEPAFPGGEAARMKFLEQHVKYPRYAIEHGIEGKVIVSFVVEKDGSITSVELLRGKHASLDEEAMRVAKLMPNWKPGLQNGKAVRVKYRMPITFSLD